MATKKYLDADGLLYLWQKMVIKFVSDADYTHTDNNFTNALATKLNGIEAGAEVNTIETVKVNGSTLTPDTNRAVNISVPTNTNQLTNGADFQTGTQVSNAISSAIAGVTQFDYQLVQTLPQSGEKGTIYLVLNSGETPNIYDEYIWVDNKWEQIGTTEVDLSNYYNKSETDTLLVAKLNTADLVAITNAEIDTIVAG